MSDALSILWSPVRFVRARCDGEIKLGVPFLIFVGALILFIVDMALMYDRITDRFPEGVQEKLGMATLGFGLNLFAFAINMLLFWILGAGILTCLAILLDGEGEYRRVLELTGLAHLPSLIFALIGLVIALTYQPQADFERLFDRNVGSLTHAQKKAFSDDLRKEVRKETTSRPFIIIHTCRYAFTLWTLVLCVIAVRYTFKLTYGRSGAIVIALVLLFMCLEMARAKLMP